MMPTELKQIYVDLLPGTYYYKLNGIMMFTTSHGLTESSWHHNGDLMWIYWCGEERATNG